MNTRRGISNPSPPGGSPSPRGRSIQHSNDNRRADVNQLSQNVGGLDLGSSRSDGDWRNKNRPNAVRPWGPPTSTPRAWTQGTMHILGTPSNAGAGRAPGGAWQNASVAPDPTINASRGNVMPQYRSLESGSTGPCPAVIPPPLAHGWNWNARATSPQQQGGGQGRGNGGTLYPQVHARRDFGADVGDPHDEEEDIDDDDDNLLAEDTDDDILSDGFDSDESVKSHETKKKSTWFKEFFDQLEKLSNDQISELSRPWHCPACQKGPGAVAWYHGLQPLMAHAKTKGSKRVRLHREFAELLDEELIRRGTSVIPAGESFGKWRGLQQTVADHDIVWPPMVIVMNTRLEQDENDKWIGMGNQELLDYFSPYKAVKARHSYSAQGHRGMSVLIFESSAMGYHEAERLHKHFATQGTSRDAWNNHPQLFYPGGKRQLYGYMARKDDLDSFNQHSTGKTRLKFELRSYQEMVVQPMVLMEERSQMVTDLNIKLERERREKKVYAQSFEEVSKKLRQTKEENLLVRKRTQELHEQNKEQMDYQEQFYKDQIDSIRQELEEKERAFEERHQAEREKMKETTGGSSQEKVAIFIESQVKGIEDFEAERAELIKQHEDEKTEMKRRYLEEEVTLEKKFTDTLTSLMAKYAPHSEEGGS